MKPGNNKISRREAVKIASTGLAGVVIAGCSSEPTPESVVENETNENAALAEAKTIDVGNTMRVHYLEIVTEDVSKACDIYGGIHGVSFGEPDMSLGGARTAKMSDGSMIGVRARMHDQENLVTRAYLLVDDIAAAVAEAEKAGALIALPPMEIPGHGTCAIYIEGGIEAGLWQV